MSPLSWTPKAGTKRPAPEESQRPAFAPLCTCAIGERSLGGNPLGTSFGLSLASSSQYAQLAARSTALYSRHPQGLNKRHTRTGTAGFTRSFGPRLRRLPCQCVHERPAITHGQQNLPLSWKHQRFAFLSVVAHCAAAQVSSGPWAPECSLRRVASRMPPASPVYNIWEFGCRSERMRLFGSEAAQPVWYAGSHLRQSPQLMQLLLLLVLVGLSWAQDVQM